MKNERYWSGCPVLDEFETVAALFKARLIGNRWAWAASNNTYQQPNIELRTSCRLHESDPNALRIERDAESGYIGVHEMSSQGGWSWGIHVYEKPEDNPYIEITPDTIKIYQKAPNGNDIMWHIVLEEKPE